MYMRVIEVNGHKLDQDKLMDIRLRSPQRHDARLILPTTSWNTKGQFLLHDLFDGRITPVDDIVELLRSQGRLTEVTIVEE